MWEQWVISVRDMSQSGASVGKRRKESVCHVNCNSSPPALPFLFHIMAHDITFLNGVALNYSIVPPLLSYICNLHFTGLWPEKNCSTYDMPGPGTSLRGHLGWSSGTSRSWSSHPNNPWMYRHGYFPHLLQFTTASLKGIPWSLPTCYPHLMMA